MLSKLQLSFWLAVLCLLSFEVSAQSTRLNTPRILSVEVLNEPGCENCVRFYWNKVAGADRYEILKYDADNPNGFPEPYPAANPYVTDTFFVDTDARPHEGQELYHVLAENTSDPLITDSEWSDTIKTLFLEPLLYDSCLQQITLSWSLYQDAAYWYRIHERVNNAAFVQSDSTQANTYVSRELQENSLYAYQLRLHDASGFFASSNIQEQQVNTLLVPNGDLQYLEEVRTQGQDLLFTCQVDSTVVVESYDLLVAISAAGPYELLTQQPYGDASIQFTVAGQVPRRYYSMQTKNVCGLYVDSTPVVRPIYLEMTQEQNAVVLNWHSGFVDAAGEQFRLLMRIDGGVATEEVLGADAMVELDLSALGDEQSESYQFQIQADNGTETRLYSNTVEALKLPFVHLPNAFTPNGDGLNDQVGPFQKYIENANAEDFQAFQFQVYDKYGGVVFNSSSPNSAWDGTKGGQALTEGPYAYYLSFTTANGRQVEHSGMLEIVYP